MCWDIFKGYLGYHSYQNYWCPQKLWCSGIFKGYQCYHSYQHWPKFVTTKKYSSPLPTITQNEQALRQLRASSINGEKLQCAIYFIPESMISEVTLVTNITRYSHIFFKTSICGTYRAPTEMALSNYTENYKKSIVVIIALIMRFALSPGRVDCVIVWIWRDWLPPSLHGEY